LNDVVARLVAPYLERSLGQPFIVDNRPVASGIVGTDATAKAPPDGYTLLMVASSFTVVPATNPKLPYDPERDLGPIIMVAKNSLLFLVNPKVPANSLAEFVTLAKANPGKLNYASPGAATQTHLVVELFSQKAGIKLQHIPYRGGAPAMTAMVAGDTQFTAISRCCRCRRSRPARYARSRAEASAAMRSCPISLPSRNKAFPASRQSNGSAC